MAAEKTEFTYRNIELYKSESLGSGSYGGVCKAKCDGLLCAAKIMHPTLFDLRDPGTTSYLRKFQEECRLLSLARHPNVVQYLATYYDPDTRLPVLLMELCDQSLTTFLEGSPGPLSYHIQINICHDVALALVYLHSNGLIHRDLTGNNVLMLAGTRAKITDFGMSKLATVNPRTTALTLCPGNLLYMSPEALDEAKSYTAKLDIFSFGVIVIQILTREFPNPIERFRSVRLAEFEEQVRVVVPETERRQSQLKLIPDTHSLKPVVLQCLKKEGQRPSAVELSERLSELKQSSQYTESQCQTQSSSHIQHLQQQLRGLTKAKSREVREHQTRITELEEEKQHMIETNVRQLQEKQHTIENKDRQLQEKECTIASRDRTVEMKERELQRTQQRLQASEQLVSEAKSREVRERETRITELEEEKQHLIETNVKEKQHTIENKDRQLQEKERTIASMDHMVEMKERELQRTQQRLQASEQSLQQKYKTISDLHQTISAHERKIQQLEQQNTVSGQQQSVTGPQTTVAAAKKDISKMTWREGKSAPERMYRGAAVVHGNTAYFSPVNSYKSYSYQIIGEEEQWSQLPDNDNMRFGLAVIDGLVTSVGGYKNGFTNTLLSLTEEGERKTWSEIFPPMPTQRQTAACITTEQALVVAGGYGHGGYLDTVEVMNINTKQWTTVSPLPQKLSQLSATVCGDTLYLAGGRTKVFTGFSSPSKSVFTCSIPDLMTSANTLGSRIRRTFSRSQNIWREINSLPVTWSTLVSFSGDLLATGGWDGSGNPTSDVYRYDSHTDSWNIVSQMKNKRSQCIAVTLPGDRIIVVGGRNSDNVEFLE